MRWSETLQVEAQGGSRMEKTAGTVVTKRERALRVFGSGIGV